MPTELAKTFDPTTTQDQALRLWHDHNAFHAEPTDPGKPYSIVIPPPNVTAALHLGHALNNTLQDILTRWHRMLGDNTMWMPGTDHAGIATQTVVEKRVLKEEGKKRTEFKRDEFIAKIQAWKDEYEQTITNQLKAMGCSCDWQRQAFTMDEPRAKAVREAFFRLFKDGLIYRGKRLVNWDPATQTALADDEVEMEEIDGHFYYLKYPVVEGESGTGGPPVNPVGSASADVVDKQESFAKANPTEQKHGRAAHATSYITVATTRPETMLGDTAVAINPKDPRAASLRGKFVRLPIVNRIIPIVEDDYVVLPDANSEDAKAKYATGFLKVTPAHDPNDYEIGRRHNLAVINVMAPDGTISDKHGWSDKGDADFVLGLDRYEARRAIVEWFKKNKLLEEVKPYRHSVGHSYRSHVPIEPYLSDQWYVKVTDDRLAGAALRAMARDDQDDGLAASAASRGGTGAPPVNSPDAASQQKHGRDAHATSNWQAQLHFHPARYAKTFQTWHENIRDWCISRQLWWGHRIPVWTAPRSGSYWEARPERASEYDRIHATLKQLEDDGRICKQLRRADEHGPLGGDDPQIAFYYYCVRSEYDREAIELLEQCDFLQDPDVLDTWFSSGLWPLSTLNWPDPSEISNPNSALNTWNPTSVLCTAREIITLWVSRMVMFNLYFENRLPFTDVFIHAMIQDGEGRKMSKSLGNGVDPLDIIQSHGADALRFTMTNMATNTQDVRMPVVHDPATNKNTSPKFDVGRNFCNKLWNAARFVLASLESVSVGFASANGTDAGETFAKANPTQAVDETRWSLADRWIVSRFNRTVEAANDALANYRFDQYAKACYDFFWGDFCDWYVEAIKPSLRDPNRKTQAAHVLAAVLDGALRLMHPMIPFITEILYQRLNEIRPKRGLPGRLECGEGSGFGVQGSGEENQSAIRNSQSTISSLLIRAPWPKVGDFSQASEHIFPRLQEIITAIRNLRNGYNVPPKQAVTVSLSAPAEPTRQLTENREMIEALATCTIKEIRPDLEPAANAVRAAAAGVDIFVEGLVDEAAEKLRVAKLCDDLGKTIKTLKGRLMNEAYISKAPPALVQQTKDQLAAAEAERAKLNPPPDSKDQN